MVLLHGKRYIGTQRRGGASQGLSPYSIDWVNAEQVMHT